MVKRIIKNSTIFILLIGTILFYRLYLLEHVLMYADAITAALLILVTGISVVFFGLKKDKKTFLKRDVIISILTIVVLFFIISYIAGFAFGFLKNAYLTTPSGIVNNTFAPIIIIFAIEVLRYSLIEGNANNKFFIFLTTFIIILFELNLNIKSLHFYNVYDIFKCFTIVVLPIISKNIVLTYLCKNVGIKPGLIYRLVMDIYIYVMPILPDLSDYINAVIGISLPFIVYLYSSRIIDKNNNSYVKNDDVVEEEEPPKSFQFSDLITIIPIIILIMLISGIGPLYLVGVGSESMNPNINKGDAVLIHKSKNENDYKVGDVIAFYDNGKMFIHRLKKIKKENGKYRFVTKGDANNAVDDVVVNIDNTVGIVKFKIPYIAYPSVYLSEHFNNKEKK